METAAFKYVTIEDFIKACKEGLSIDSPIIEELTLVEHQFDIGEIDRYEAIVRANALTR